MTQFRTRIDMGSRPGITTLHTCDTKISCIASLLLFANDSTSRWATNLRINVTWVFFVRTKRMTSTLWSVAASRAQETTVQSRSHEECGFSRWRGSWDSSLSISYSSFRRHNPRKYFIVVEMGRLAKIMKATTIIETEVTAVGTIFINKYLLSFGMPSKVLKRLVSGSCSGSLRQITRSKWWNS